MKKLTMPMAVLCVGFMGFIAFICWLTKSTDPLWMLLFLTWLFYD